LFQSVCYQPLIRLQFEQVGLIESDYIYVQLKKSDYIWGNKCSDTSNFTKC